MQRHPWNPWGRKKEWRHMLCDGTPDSGPADLPDLYSAIWRTRLAAAWGQRQLAAQALFRLQGSDRLRTALRTLRRYRHRRGAWAFQAQAWATLQDEA
eukprot:15482763-Alexandrium_andersonii.AAC.1